MFTCNACGFESIKWLGKCPNCERWNSFTEIKEEKFKENLLSVIPYKEEVKTLPEITTTRLQRLSSGIKEFDNVVGGGLMPGSVTLIGGDPGIGKSTLLLQICAKIEEKYGTVIYLSGEESAGHIKLRAEKLNIKGDNLYIISGGNLNTTLDKLNELASTSSDLTPKLLIVDSIQTVFWPGLSTVAGSILQIKDCTRRLLYAAKKYQIPVIIVGHMTKNNALAGPKLIEHIVDTVLYFEYKRPYSFRILRAVKNRFGSINQIGVFEMLETGLSEVPNPSEAFLKERLAETPGSAVTVVIEGIRPILIELQALTARSPYYNVRREAVGLHYNRFFLVVAVLEKKIGLNLSNQDLFMNIVGGLKVEEPAADLACACAIVSSLYDLPLKGDTIVIGEIGLTGEIRAVPYLEKRIEEALKLGFKRIVMPKTNFQRPISIPEEVISLPVRTLYEALQILGLLK